MTCQEDNSLIDLNEVKNERVARALFSSVSQWLTDGTSENINLKGSQQQLEAIQRVMLASKRFHEELNSSTTSLENIAEKLQEKHTAAELFESRFGVRWSL